jgi:hypothetical protein
MRCDLATLPLQGVRHRSPGRAFLAICALLVGIPLIEPDPAPVAETWPGGPADPGRALDLDHLPQELPYRFIQEISIEVSSQRGYPPPPLGSGDLDGDGADELFYPFPTRVHSLDLHSGKPVAGWSYRLEQAADEWRRPQPGAVVSLKDPATGEPRPVLLLTIQAADDGGCWLWGIPPPAQTPSLRIRLPECTGGSPQEPARAQAGAGVATAAAADEGMCKIAGVLPADPAHPHPAAIVFQSPGGDSTVGTIVALDLSAGQPVWRLRTPGALDVDRSWLGDLDGDGGPEIVLVARAPATGVEGSCELIVVDGWAGRIETSWPLGNGDCLASLAVTDLNGDGNLEIITGTHDRAPLRSDEVCVRSGRSGELLVRKLLPAGVTGLVALPASGHQQGAIYVGLTSGVLEWLDYRQRRLGLMAVSFAAGPVTPLAAGDLTSLRDDRELMVLTASGTLVLLSENLRPLAATRIAARDSLPEPRATHWRAGEGYEFLLVESGDTWGFRLERAGWTWPGWLASGGGWPFALIMLLTGALLAGATFRGAMMLRHRLRPGAVATGGPRPPQRVVLGRLLRELEQAHHGSLSATRSLRRLVWLLQGYASEAQPSPRLTERIRQVMTDSQDTGCPQLQAVLKLAGRTTFARALVRDARAALDESRRLISTISARTLSPDAIDLLLPDLARAVGQLESRLQELRARLEQYFSCDAGRTLELALRLREEEFARLGIQTLWCLNSDTTAPGASPPARNGHATCSIDPADLRVVLDILLDQAIGELTERGWHDLVVKLSAVDNGLLLEIAGSATAAAGSGDTAGPPKDHAQPVLPPSGRRGDPALGRARELLARWDGDLRVDWHGDEWFALDVTLRPVWQASGVQA